MTWTRTSSLRSSRSWRTPATPRASTSSSAASARPRRPRRSSASRSRYARARARRSRSIWRASAELDARLARRGARAIQRRIEHAASDARRSRGGHARGGRGYRVGPARPREHGCRGAPGRPGVRDGVREGRERRPRLRPGVRGRPERLPRPDPRSRAPGPPQAHRGPGREDARADAYDVRRVPPEGRPVARGRRDARDPARGLAPALGTHRRTSLAVACFFCDRLAAGDLTVENELSAAFLDAFPLTRGHTLVVPRRHEADDFALTGSRADGAVA